MHFFLLLLWNRNMMVNWNAMDMNIAKQLHPNICAIFVFVSLLGFSFGMQRKKLLKAMSVELIVKEDKLLK